MHGFRSNGTTILLVSHNAEAVARLCQRAMWLDQRVGSLTAARTVPAPTLL